MYQLLFAAEPGLEPRLTEPETVVLPLDDSAIYFLFKSQKFSIFLNLFWLKDPPIHTYKNSVNN